MNELLQRHGCSNVFTIPEGLKELMSDISREVLRDQPTKMFDYICNYLSVLLITREHGILSVKILDDLCDCRPSVSEHLLHLGLGQNVSEMLAQIIKEAIEGFEPEEGKEKVKETQILKKILSRVPMDEEMAAQVCQVARNAYRDYWYRKNLLETNLKVHPHEAWEVAAERTLELYKKTKPSYSELSRATQKIQAAYRGYYVRRNLLRHLKPKKPGKHAKVDLPGPPADVAASREIDLGPVINVRVHEEDTESIFKKEIGKSLNVGYDPMKTITHVGMADDDKQPTFRLGSRSDSAATKSVTGPGKSTQKPMFKGTDQPDPMEEEPYRLPHMEGGSKAELSKSHFQEPQPSDTHIPKAESRASMEQEQLNKISFAMKPHEKVIDDDYDEKFVAKADDAEIPEEIRAAEPPQEDAQEVPEDIIPAGDSAPEDDSEAEGNDSVPLTSDPATDVDDAGVPTEDEE